MMKPLYYYRGYLCARLSGLVLKLFLGSKYSVDFKWLLQYCAGGDYGLAKAPQATPWQSLGHEHCFPQSQEVHTPTLACAAGEKHTFLSPYWGRSCWCILCSLCILLALGPAFKVSKTQSLFSPHGFHLRSHISPHHYWLNINKSSLAHLLDSSLAI